MIQIEVTTACDLSCRYCFRNGNAADISEKIIEKLAGCDKEYVLYGYGEPLRNRNLETIAERLGGRIVLSTNGINDISGILETVDRVGFSLDSTYQNYLSKFRRGSDVKRITKNLKMAGEKAFIESVVTAENLSGLEEVVKLGADLGVDVKFTNVVAPEKDIYKQTLYFEASRRIIELAEEINQDFIVNVIHDYAKGRGKFLEKYREIHMRAEEEGYLLNLPYILESGRRIQIATEAERRLNNLREFGIDMGIEVDIPNFFGDSKDRNCPYLDSIFVRVDGKVSSCMPFSRPHTEVVNDHLKKVEPFIVGDLNSQDYDEVTSSLAQFEKVRKDMTNFPWCADCPHVKGCWYVEHNQDCYVNAPSCGECLYSAGIAKCVFS